MSATDKVLLQQLLRFRREREWEQFHTPKNLAIALTVEAAELLECFQWTKDADIADLIDNRRADIEDEIADVAIVLSLLCNDIGVDIESAVRRKLHKNELKYPVHLARGNAEKYDKL